jgi:hypothetical protein
LNLVFGLHTQQQRGELRVKPAAERAQQLF